MSRDQRRYFLAVLLLVLAASGAMAIRLRDNSGPMKPTISGYEFLADIDHWQRTERERVVTSPYNFSLASDLTALPLQLDGWSGMDVPQTNLEVAILLDPEQYVYRLYHRPDGSAIWLSLIGSRKSKSFHSPQICYDTDGWQTDASATAVSLAQGELYTLHLLARKSFGEGGAIEHLVLYFYLWPGHERNLQDGMVLVKVTVPVSSSPEQALELASEFIRTLFTSART